MLEKLDRCTRRGCSNSGLGQCCLEPIRMSTSSPIYTMHSHENVSRLRKVIWKRLPAHSQQRYAVDSRSSSRLDSAIAMTLNIVLHLGGWVESGGTRGGYNTHTHIRTYMQAHMRACLPAQCPFTSGDGDTICTGREGAKTPC